MKKSILTVVHDSAKNLYNAGLLDYKTMRTFDAACLTPVHELSPKKIKAIRLKEKVSQPVFAAFLNTTSSTIKKWESGEKHPRGISLKMLNIIEKNGLASIA